MSAPTAANAPASSEPAALHNSNPPPQGDVANSDVLSDLLSHLGAANTEALAKREEGRRDDAQSPILGAAPLVSPVPVMGLVASASAAATRPDTDSSDSASDHDEPVPDEATLPAWMLDLAGVTSSEFRDLRPHLFDAVERAGMDAWSDESMATYAARIENVPMHELRAYLRLLHADDQDARALMEARLIGRLRQLRTVLEMHRTDESQQALRAEVTRVLSDANLTANAELRARHSEGEGGVPVAYLWSQGRLSELATSEDALLAAIKSNSALRLRENDTLVVRSGVVDNNMLRSRVRMAFQEDAQANAGPKAASAAVEGGGVVWTPLSVVKTRVHVSVPAATDAMLLTIIKQSPWLVFDPELQCARLSRRDEWHGDDLRVLSASQAAIVAEAHAEFDAFEPTWALYSIGRAADGVLSGVALHSRVLFSLMSRDPKATLQWDQFARACALSTTLQVHSMNPTYTLNEKEKQKRIESFALLADAGRTPPPALLPNAAASKDDDAVAAPSADPTVAVAPSCQSPACYFRCTASVADLLVPSSSYSDLQRAEHDHAVLIWSLLPRPAAEQANTNQPHRVFNNEKSTTISNPPPIYIVPQELVADNAAAANAALPDDAAAPLLPRSSLAGSCSFSVRLTHLSPFNRLQLGFRQNSMFGCSYLLQLCMGGSEAASPPPGHGELRRMKHVQRFRHEIFPGDELFQPEETTAERSSSLVAARQSIAQRSSTVLGRFNRLPSSVQMEIEEGLGRALKSSPAPQQGFFIGDQHPFVLQIRQLASSLAKGEIFEQRAEQMLEHEALGSVPQVFAGFKDAVEAATTAVEMDRPEKPAREDEALPHSRSEPPALESSPSSSNGGPMIVPLPPLRLGSVFTVRYDADRDEIRFSLNGREIPEATCTRVLTRHAQPKDLPHFSIDFLHAMIPVMLCSGLGVQVECVPEEEGIAEANRIAAMVDVAPAALVPSALAPLRDLAPAFAREQALLRASVNSGSVEQDTHMTHLVPCASSSIPGLLRLFLHDWAIGQALGLPYFSIPIIDCITEYVQYTAPNLGTDKFGWMSFWAAHVRSSMINKADQKAHTLVSSLFATTFPFKSISVPSRIADSADIFHDLAAVGEISSTGTYPSGNPVSMTGPVGLWARFADKHPDTLRSEDYAQMERMAAEESRTALDRSVGSGEIEGLDGSEAPSASPARKLLRDEDGQIIFDPDAASKEPVHSDVHPDEDRDRYMLTQPAAPSLIPPFSLLTPEDLLRPPPSALIAAHFDLRVPPAAALDRLQMLRQSIYHEMESMSRGTRLPWHLRVEHPAEAIHGIKDLDTNQSIVTAAVATPALAPSVVVPSAGFTTVSNNPFFHNASDPLTLPAAAAPTVAARPLVLTTFAANSAGFAGSNKGVTWTSAVGTGGGAGFGAAGLSADEARAAAAPAPASAASAVAASSDPSLPVHGGPLLSPVPPLFPSAAPGPASAAASAASAAPSSSSSSYVSPCSLCGLPGHVALDCPRRGPHLGGMFGAPSFGGGGAGRGGGGAGSFAGAGAPGGPGHFGTPSGGGFGAPLRAAPAFGGGFGGGVGAGAWAPAPALQFPGLAAGPAPAAAGGWVQQDFRIEDAARARSRGADAMHDGDEQADYRRAARGRGGRRR